MNHYVSKMPNFSFEKVLIGYESTTMEFCELRHWASWKNQKKWMNLYLQSQLVIVGVKLTSHLVHNFIWSKLAMSTKLYTCIYKNKNKKVVGLKKLTWTIG